MNQDLKNISLSIDSNDSLLIKEYKKGNRLAYNLIVRKYQKRIYWVIRKIVLDHDDADDITQEVFIKLYKSLIEFRGDSSLMTYIYRMAVNYSLNHLTRIKNKNTKVTSINDKHINLKNEDKSFDEIMDNKQKTKLLEEAMSRLPEQQRAVFNLRYYDNLTYEEISKILNKSVGGLKANYFHAVKKIGEYLKQKEVNLEILF